MKRERSEIRNLYFLIVCFEFCMKIMLQKELLAFSNLWIR